MDKSIVRRFVLEMVPADGREGVDVDSPCYLDMLEERAADFGVSSSELDNAVKDAIRKIGEQGFGGL